MKAPVAACLLALAWPALAHDTWLAVQPPVEGRTALALGTGHHFPRPEAGVPAASLGEAHCVDGTGARRPLAIEAETKRALQLRTDARGPFACWAALNTHDAALTPAQVEAYLRDIRPPEAVRVAWAAQQRRGLAWSERYVKFARIEHGTRAATPQALQVLRAPVGLPLELVIEGDAPLRVGAPARFRLLAEGRPVAGQPVQLLGEHGAVGLWSRTDAEGRLGWRLPFGGTWLLRTTLLEADGDAWRSRFATLAFDL